MGNMRFKVGDRVRIKSLDWYNENKDEYGDIDISHDFTFYADRSKYCGKVFTIDVVFDNCYTVKEDNHEYYWADEMIEGLVEEETLIERVDDNGLPFNEWLSHKGAFHVPEDYVLKDENGNEILTSKIILEKKKKEVTYPKTYEECCKIIHSDPNFYVDTHLYSDILGALYKLFICRDAYWKIAGEEMGLDDPWEHDWEGEHQKKYIIGSWLGTIQGLEENFVSHPFAFSTEEMRDAFYENFKELIEQCKELL